MMEECENIIDEEEGEISIDTEIQDVINSNINENLNKTNQDALEELIYEKFQMTHPQL